MGIENFNKFSMPRSQKQPGTTMSQHLEGRDNSFGLPVAVTGSEDSEDHRGHGCSDGPFESESYQGHGCSDGMKPEESEGHWCHGCSDRPRTVKFCLGHGLVTVIAA